MKINLFPLHWGLPMGNCEHFANLGGLEVHLLLLLRTEPPAEKGTPPPNPYPTWRDGSQGSKCPHSPHSTGDSLPPRPA